MISCLLNFIKYSPSNIRISCLNFKLFALFSHHFLLPSSFFLLVFLSGCASHYNLATEKEEFLIYDTEKEISIGRKFDKRLLELDKILFDTDVNERVKNILDRIVQASDRQDLVYFIRVIDDESINASAVPGGYIYVFKGLIDAVDNDDQLAGVIAHEVGHITAHHGVKRLQKAYGALALQVLASTQGGQVARGTNLALTTIFSEFSQHDEFEADKLSVKYMLSAGYDPNEMVNFLVKLDEEREKASLREFSYFKTHPNPKQRMAVVRKEISGEIKYKDYLNLMNVNQSQYVH